MAFLMDYMRGMRRRRGIRINPNDLVKTTGRKELPSTQIGRLNGRDWSEGSGNKSQIQWWARGEMWIGCLSRNVLDWMHVRKKHTSAGSQ